MLLSRSQSSDFIRLEGLQKLTNVTAHDWDLYILKELVDNALDADEMVHHESGSPSIRVVMEYDRQGNGLRVTVTNSALFPLEYVSDLFDLEKRVSVKDYYNHPTRGAQGNALKTILGIPYALHYRFLSDYKLDEVPLAITCRDQRVEIRLDVDELKQSVSVITEEETEEDDVRDETTVSVGIFRFIQKRPRTIEELKKWAQAFSLFNPHASFSFIFVILKETGEVVEETYESQSNPNWKDKYDLSQPAPITWYTYSEFKELIYAILANKREYGKPAPTLNEIANQFGISAFPQASEFSASTSLEVLMDGDALRTDSTRRLFTLLKHQTPQTAIPPLGSIGEQHLLANSRVPVPDDEDDPLFFYRHAEGGLSVPANADMPVYPFVLEVALNANAAQKRQIIVGINHTPTYQDPFFNKPLLPHGAEIEEVQHSLEKLLDYYNLRDDMPITLTVHLIAPNVEYENYGKWSISDEPYRDTLTRLIHEVVEDYREATRPPEPVDHLTEPAQQLIVQAVKMLAGRSFSENQLLAQLKRLLMQRNQAEIIEDLALQTADVRLRAVIRNYHAANPKIELIQRPSGRIAVPRHPRDSINVFIDNVHLLELLSHYQSRAILITPREALEDLFIALEFPIHYDCAILRGDGNFRSAVDLLLYRLSLVASDVAEDDRVSLPKLWLVRDATLDGAQQAHAIRQMLQQRNLPADILIDLGLHVHDVNDYDVLRDKLPEAPASDHQALKRVGLSSDDIQFLAIDGYSVQLDSMTPATLAYWFESMLQRHNESLKAIPDADSLTGLVIEDLRSRFRRIVSDIAYDTHRLETVQIKVVEEWRTILPDWAVDLHSRLLQSLYDNPRQCWQHLLEEALNSMMRDYLTAEREAAIRRIVSE
jgi:hypothetical protein